MRSSGFLFISMGVGPGAALLEEGSGGLDWALGVVTLGLLRQVGAARVFAGLWMTEPTAGNNRCCCTEGSQAE